MKIRFILLLIASVVSAGQACTNQRQSINGVTITKATTWSNIIDDSADKLERKYIRNTVEDQLLSSRFDDLDALAESYRSSRKQFKNGEWALNVFYSGLTHYQVNIPKNEENWEIRLSKLSEWVNSRPNSVTARIALSECLVGYAFAGRGYGYANTVTGEQQKVFDDRMQEARTVLGEATDMQDKCPQWRAVNLRFKGHDMTKDKYEQVFQDAIKRAPDFSLYYFRMAILLMPRWYGNDGELEQFCKSVADSVGGNRGDILYAQIIWFLDYNYGTGNLGNLNPRIDWIRVKRGIESIS